jgi:pilus assembly protein Flp/PilA
MFMRVTKYFSISGCLLSPHSRNTQANSWTGIFRQPGIQEFQSCVICFTALSTVTAIDVGLIAALIAVVIIGAVKIVGTDLTTTFTSIGTALAGAA